MSESETRDQAAPPSERPQEIQRNWQTVIEVAAVAGGAGALAHDIYTDIKAVGKAAVNKIREHGSRPAANPAKEGEGE